MPNPALTGGESYAYYVPGRHGFKGSIEYLGIYDGFSPSNFGVLIEETDLSVNSKIKYMHHFPNRNRYSGSSDSSIEFKEGHFDNLELVIVPEPITKEIEKTLLNKNTSSKKLYNYYFNIVPKLLPLFSEEVKEKAVADEKIRIADFKKAATNARPNLKAALNAALVPSQVNNAAVIGGNRKRATRRRGSRSSQKRKTTRR